MLLWIGYQWAPLVPTLDLQNISNALKPLVRSPQVDAVRPCTTLAWLAFFKLWELAAGKPCPPGHGDGGGPLASSAPSCSSSAPASQRRMRSRWAWPWFACPGASTPWPVPVLSIAMFISLAASGLAPYEPLGQAQAFHWIPFTGMLQGSMGTNLLNLAEKASSLAP